MAHDDFYDSLSSFDGTWSPAGGVADTRDNRDPQLIGEKLLDLRGSRFKKRPMHKIHDWLEELSA